MSGHTACVRDAWAAVSRWRDSTASAVASAVAVTAVLLVGAYGEAHPASPTDKMINGHPVPHTPAAALLLVAAAGLALAGRRSRPLAALAASTAAVVAYTALGYVNGAALLAPPIALYSVAVRSPVRRALLAGLATLAALMTVTGAAQPFGVTGGGFDLIPFEVAAACLGGVAVASRRAYAASLQARAEREAALRVDEERLRIARELHDVVAHTMATINVQAGVAAHLLADRPHEPAREALVAIRNASRQGLQELRAILNVLRQADEADPTQPTPVLAQVPTLVDGACAAGLPTTLQVDGSPRQLPAPVELAAYRIVQESLTNALRHAGSATASVRLDYQAAQLEVTVRDTGMGRPAGPSDGAGQGILGMRERAATVGGTLDAGRAGDGGWRVTARLPLGAAPAHPELNEVAVPPFPTASPAP